METFSKISSLISIYTQLCLVIVVIFTHRNFKSRIVMIEYFLHVGTVALMTYRMMPHFCMYRFGVSWQQWLIVLCLASLTCLLTWILSSLVNQWSASDYFVDELESNIMLEEEDHSHFSTVLKEFHWIKRKK